MMRKENIVEALIFLLLIYMLIVTITPVKKYEFEYPENTPENFNFVLNFTNGDDIVDTFKNKYTKGITWEKDTLINLSLSQSEKDKIYALMKEIDIINYPNFYVPKSTIIVSPANTYYFRCVFDCVEFEIKWKSLTASKEIDAAKLRGFFDFIYKIVKEHKEVKDLPKSKRFRL